MGFLSAPWKLATGGAGLLAAVLGFLLFTTHLQNKDLGRQRDALIAKIEDPKTGFVARLTQANANVVTLQGSVRDQNEKIRLAGVAAAADQRKLEALRKQLAEAQANTAAMQVRLNHFLATKPQGSTLEARVNDIDHRVLEELK